MEIIMEVIVDLMLPTQGHSSICNQVNDEYNTLLCPHLHTCLLASLLLTLAPSFPRWIASTWQGEQCHHEKLLYFDALGCQKR